MTPRGFTLVELLIVIALVLVLIALCVGVIVSLIYQVQIARTEAIILNLDTALRNYRTDNAAFPPGGGAARMLETHLCAARNAYLDGRTLARKPYLEKAEFADAWGHEIRYRSPGVRNPGGVDVWSPGKNGVDGDGDDVANWD